jgi:hypothetical protein
MQGSELTAVGVIDIGIDMGICANTHPNKHINMPALNVELVIVAELLSFSGRN